jgi:hypothetical protein
MSFWDARPHRRCPLTDGLLLILQEPLELRHQLVPFAAPDELTVGPEGQEVDSQLTHGRPGLALTVVIVIVRSRMKPGKQRLCEQTSSR